MTSLLHILSKYQKWSFFPLWYIHLVQKWSLLVYFKRLFVSRIIASHVLALIIRLDLLQKPQNVLLRIS